MSEKRRARPATERPTPELPNGMSMARRVVFETDVNAQGWPMRMLLAIATAKGLGFNLFEIDVKGRLSREAKKKATGMFMSFGDIWGPASADEGEEWKQAKPEVPKKDEHKCVLTVYAVVVE